MTAYSKQQVSEATGFDQGERFNSEEEVRAYFTATEQRRMLGGYALRQSELNRMADAVIANRWHFRMRSTADALDTPWRVMHAEYQRTDQTGMYEPIDWFAPEVEAAIDEAAEDAGLPPARFADVRQRLAAGIPDGDTPRESIQRAAEYVAETDD